MKINLLKNYGGSRTKEQRILPGVYDSEDAALFGLADYLVENGHAIELIPDSVYVEAVAADGVWADDMPITTQSHTYSEGVPVEAIVVKVAQEDIDILRAEVQEVAEEIAANLESEYIELPEESKEEVPDAKPKRGRPKKK